MKKNMGTVDRVLRIVLAVVLGYLYYNGTIAGTWGIVGLVAAVIFAGTSFVSFCPLYTIFGLSTCKVKS